MRMITCKRCHHEVPKSASIHEKVHGGRICKPCGRFMSEPKRYHGSERIPAGPSVQPPAHAPRKLGLVNRIVNRLFRRRGVQ